MKAIFQVKEVSGSIQFPLALALVLPVPPEDFEVSRTLPRQFPSRVL